MNKHSVLVFVLLLSGIALQVKTAKGSLRELELSALVVLGALDEAIDKATGIKVSEIIGKIASFPARIIDSTPLVSSFVNSVVDIGIKYAKKETNLSLKYLLFTPVSPNKWYNLELGKKSIDHSTFDPGLDTKFLIYGLATELGNSSVYFDIKDNLLQAGDYNIIVVNWSEYNGYPYVRASLYAVLVGFEVAKLIELLMDSKGINSSSVHLIGHSLGSQACGFAGKVIPNIGRISGLDAAGPIFEYLPKSMRLTDTDADFVDAIHTNGAASVLEGFGTIDPYGDMDFFPNGGSIQPGCSYGDTFLDSNKESHTVTNLYYKILCNHEKVLFLFMESINVCQFDSIQCSSYQDFEDKRCPQKSSAISRMGFHAIPSTSLSVHSKFYLETTQESPFCVQN